MGWRMLVKSQGLDLKLIPALPDQELDTTDSTGMVYWEGSVNIEGSRRGQTLSGSGYVEMTGYGPKG